MPNTTKPVLVPVTATLLVPLDVELPDDLELQHDDALGADIANVGERADLDAIVGALNDAAAGNESVSDALAALLSGLMLYQRDNPTVRGRYTPCLGIVPESEI